MDRFDEILMEFPYEVTPADPHWALYKEIDAWLKEHIPESDWRRFIGSTVYRFKHEQDAMLFMLRWL